MKTTETTPPIEPQSPVAIVSVQTWLRSIGRSETTFWRWRKAGMIAGTININGRLFMTQAAIDQFTRRAVAGEFKRTHPKPPTQLAA